MGKWDGMVTRRDTGTWELAYLLVLLVACRGLGAHHLSVLLRLESLRALVALEFAQISTADGTHARTGPDTHNDFKHTRTQPHANQQLTNAP